MFRIHIDKSDKLKNKDIKICTVILNTILLMIYVSMFIMAILYYTCTINQLQAITYLIIITIVFIMVLVLYIKVKTIQKKRK